MPKTIIFKNRQHAGQLLARRLAPYARRADVTVIGLPRGGVPVAAVIAEALGLPLAALIVRKLGVPGHRELAMGAVASGGLCVLQPDTVRMLHIDSAAVERAMRDEMREIERRQAAYGPRVVDPESGAGLRGRVLIVVDDGLATGATMWAAIQVLRQAQPARLLVAVPVGAADTCAALRAEVDELVCLQEPSPFHAVGQWYRDFRQVEDAEVKALLDGAAQAADTAVDIAANPAVNPAANPAANLAANPAVNPATRPALRRGDKQ